MEVAAVRLYARAEHCQIIEKWGLEGEDTDRADGG
jgi:hypothetical protein